MKPDAFAIEQAKQFLKNRILDQAAIDNVPLSKAEIATLTYSEPTATQSERKLADEVDAKIGTDEYEDKISTLLLHAYDRDLERGAHDEWKRHLNALRDEDLYVLVMLENAGIAGGPKKAATRTTLSKDIKSLKFLLNVDILCLALVGLGGGYLLLHLPSFLSSDWGRAGAFAAWIATLWLTGQWASRRTFRN